jgi:hypothetical protein
MLSAAWKGSSDTYQSHSVRRQIDDLWRHDLDLALIRARMPGLSDASESSEVGPAAGGEGETPPVLAVPPDVPQVPAQPAEPPPVPAPQPG